MKDLYKEISYDFDPINNDFIKKKKEINSMRIRIISLSIF